MGLVLLYAFWQVDGVDQPPRYFVESRSRQAIRAFKFSRLEEDAATILYVFPEHPPGLPSWYRRRMRHSPGDEQKWNFVSLPRRVRAVIVSCDPLKEMEQVANTVLATCTIQPCFVVSFAESDFFPKFTRFDMCF